MGEKRSQEKTQEGARWLKALDPWRLGEREEKRKSRLGKELKKEKGR